MPQIDQIAEIYASQLFWLVVVFALIYFGIGKAMLPKIGKTVDDRNARISGDLAAAQAARAAADSAEQTYLDALAKSRGEAQAAAAKAKADAATATEGRVKAADAVLRDQAAEAEARLDQQRLEAEKGLETVAAEAAREMASRIAGLGVTADEAAEAVRTASARPALAA